MEQYSQGAGDLGPPHGMCPTFQPDPDRLSTQQCQQTNSVLAFIATTVEFEFINASSAWSFMKCRVVKIDSGSACFHH